LQSKTVVAALPDDSFGPPDPSLGPALAVANGEPLRGSHSLYYAPRLAGTDKRSQETHTGAVSAIAETIIAAFIEEQAALSRPH